MTTTTAAPAPLVRRPGAGFPARARRRVMRFLRSSHRWLALSFGVLLLVMTTTGSILLFKPELERRLHGSMYHATASAHPIGAVEAMRIVERDHALTLAPTSAGRDGPVWAVSDGTRTAYVDPGTGRVNGVLRHAGETGVLGFLENLHECGLTCAPEPGTIAWLSTPMPGLGIPGLHKVTIASFIIGVTGLCFVVLVLGGLAIWWPGLRRWKRGFQYRRAKGRYARHYDLHKLVGVVALPFLAMWAFTGTNFELPVMHELTDIVLPGSASKAADYTFTSRPAPKGTAEITPAQAAAAALRVTHGGHVLAISMPVAGDATSTYGVNVDKGYRWWRDYPGYEGGKFIGVDRHDAARARDQWHITSPAQALYGKQAEAAHFGTIVGWLPRLVLLAMGLTPLVLAFTGISTWLLRRDKRRRGRRRRLEIASA